MVKGIKSEEKVRFHQDFLQIDGTLSTFHSLSPLPPRLKKETPTATAGPGTLAPEYPRAADDHQHHV